MTTENLLKDLGYHQQRRTFIKAAGGMSLLGLLTMKLKAIDPQDRMDTLDWDQFLAAAVPLAKKTHGPLPHEQDRYLYSMAALASQLGEEPQGAFRAFGHTGMHLNLCYRGTPFIVLKWRLDPGGYLPAHNHPEASVCSLCLSGEVRVRNFQVVGKAPAYDSGKPVSLRQTVDQTLTPGRINTLSGYRDNIHYFQAGAKGASGIDITSAHGEGGPFSFLNIDETPNLADPTRFTAQWIGNKPQ